MLVNLEGMEQPVTEAICPEDIRSVYKIDVELTELTTILDWCYGYATNLSSGDVSSPLIRWNVAVYQLADVCELLKEKNYNPDVCEALAASLIHAMIVKKNFDVYNINGWSFVITSIRENFAKLCKNAHKPPYLFLTEDVLVCVPKVTRQLVYHELKRVRRFDGTKLSYDLDVFIEQMFSLLYIMCGRHYPIAFSLATHKLQIAEWKGH